MARYAVVENGKVANIIEWDGVAQYPNSDSLISAPDHAHMGGDYADGVFSVKQPVEDTGTYAEKRVFEYPPIADVVVALAELQEGRTSMWDEVHTKRNEIRAKFPKP